MKKLDSRTLRYIAKAYGKNFAGDESDPKASEVTPLDAPLEEAAEAASHGASGSWDTLPPAGYDGSPEANPNVPVSAGALAQANMTPEELDVPIKAESPKQEDAAPASDALKGAMTSETPAAQGPSDYEKAGVPDLEAGFKNEQKANQAIADAQATEGAAEVDALTKAQNAIAALPTANERAEKFKEKDGQLMKAYQDKELDPNRYLHSLSTGQKIMAGLAIIISGAGAGGSGQPNMAAQMIDDKIKADIDAQKNSQDKSMNLWKMNKEEYGNDLAANLATQNQILVGTQVQLQQAAANAKGPLAQANAAAANSLIQQKLDENRFKLSLMKPTSDSFGLDPAKKVSWLVPKEHQQKVFDEIDAAQNTARNAPAILKAFDDAANTIHGADFIPGVDNADQKAFHALLGPTFKDVEGTVRQAAMDNMFKNTTPVVGDNARTKMVKRQAVIDYMTAKSAAPTASGYGINLGEYPSTNVEGAIPVAPGKKPQAPAVKTMNGIKYQQVRGGWKKIQ